MPTESSWVKCAMQRRENWARHLSVTQPNGLVTFAVYVPTRLQQEKWNPNLLVKPSFSIIQIFASFVRNCSFLVNNPKFDLVMTCCPH